MDFPDYWDKDEVLAEFSLKFKDSYIKLNEQIHKLKYVKDDTLLTDFGIYNLNDNHVITKLKLKSGLYKNKDSLIFIYKLPKRQWCKGVIFGETHGVVSLQGSLSRQLQSYEYLGNHGEFTIGETTYHYIYNKIIGTCRNNFELIVNKHSEYLFKEIEELWKQYKVISESDYQKLMVEKPKAIFR